MAGQQNKPEFPHLLAPGRHRMSLSELQRRCVKPFAESATRERLFFSFATLLAYLETNAGACEVWVDGSFVTEKPNPEDIDLTIVLHGDELDRLARDNPTAAADLILLAQDVRFRPDLHVFMVACRPMGHPHHAIFAQVANNWAQWWSVTRESWFRRRQTLRAYGTASATR